MPAQPLLRLAVLVLVAALNTGPARAQVTALRQIPEGLDAATRSALAAQRDRLRIRRAQMAKDGRLFNSQCASVARNSPEAASCRKRFAALDGKRRAYDGDAKAFNARVGAAVAGDRRKLAAEIAKLRTRIGRHRQALSQLGFTTTAQQFESYAEMSRDGQLAAKKTLATAIINLTFGALQGIVDNPVSKATATKLRADMEAAGIGDPFVLEAAGNLHRLVGDPQKTREFLLFTKAAMTQSLNAATTADGGVMLLKAIDGMIGLTWSLVALSSNVVETAGPPKALMAFRMIPGALEFAVTYENARTGIDQLARANDRQLRGLKEIQALLGTDVAALGTAKRSLARLGGR